MNLNTWIAMVNDWSGLWWSAVVRAGWQGGVALALAWAACALLPRLPAAARCWLWRLAFLKLLVAFVWATPVDLPLLAPQPKAAVRMEGQGTPRPVSFPTVAHGGGRAEVAPSPSPIQSAPSGFALLMFCWVAGATALAFRLGLGFTEALRLRAGCTPAEAPALQMCWRAVCTGIGLRRTPALLVAHGSPGPVSLALPRPAVALPAQLLGLPERQLRMILAHEAAHLKRADLWWAWLPAAAQVLFFFHPLVWLANREWLFAQEAACDAEALRWTGSEFDDYAEALVGALAGCRKPRAHFSCSPATLSAAGCPALLKRRLLAMKVLRSIPYPWLRSAAVVTVLAGAVGVVPWRAVAQNAPSETLLFSSSRGPGHITLTLFSMNADGSNAARLTDGESAEFDPARSPDRMRIAFGSIEPKTDVGSICLIDADGKHRTQLTPGVAKTLALGPAWSPDGNRIAYYTVTDPAPETGMAAKGTVHVMDADGKNDRSLGDGLHPVWSPDGKSLYFSLGDGGRGPYVLPALYRMNADGTDRQQLARRGIAGGWSPDGSRLAYTGDAGDGKFHLFVMNADGSDVRQLTKTADAQELSPHWSADGKRLYCTRISSAAKDAVAPQIYVLDADGSHPRPLTPGETVVSVLDAAGGALFLMDHPEGPKAPAAQ